jgi:hypothetical protein
MAVVFMLTSLTLGYFSGKKPSSSIFDSQAAEVQPAGQRSTPTGDEQTGSTPVPIPQPDNPPSP